MTRSARLVRIDGAYLNRLFIPIDWENTAQRREVFAYTARAVLSNTSALLVQDQSEGTDRWFIPYACQLSMRNSLEGFQLPRNADLVPLTEPRVGEQGIEEIPGSVYKPFVKAGVTHMVVTSVDSICGANRKLVIGHSCGLPQPGPYDLRYDACARNMIYMIAGTLSRNGLGHLRDAQLPGLSQTAYLAEREELLCHHANDYAAYWRGSRVVLRRKRDEVIAKLASRGTWFPAYVVKIGNTTGSWVRSGQIRGRDAADGCIVSCQEQIRGAIASFGNDARRRTHIEGLVDSFTQLWAMRKSRDAAFREALTALWACLWGLGPDEIREEKQLRSLEKAFAMLGRQQRFRLKDAASLARCLASGGLDLLRPMNHD